MIPEDILALYSELETLIPEKEKKLIEDLKRKYFSPQLNLWELSLSGVVSDHFRLRNKNQNNQKAIFEKANPIIEKIEEMLRKKGLRDNIHTGQEHSLIGSTTTNSYGPFVVLGMKEEEKLTIEETRKARELRGVLRVGILVKEFWNYTPQEGEELICPLVDLDEQGRTLHDPPLYRVRSIEDYMLNGNFELLIEGFASELPKDAPPYRRG